MHVSVCPRGVTCPLTCASVWAPLHPSRAPTGSASLMHYKYTPDLLQLDKLRPDTLSPTPSQLHPSVSPLTARLEAWRSRLAAHPDREFAEYILEGLQLGFRIGFDYSHPLVSSRRNMRSARLHPNVVEEYLYGECAEGRIIGPLASTIGIHTSRFGVIPKGHTPGKWRLITDLSSPEGRSVNDGIDSTLCSLQYTSVDRIARVAASFGPGSLLAKIDRKSAYRLVPVHQDDRPLLGVSWQGQCCMDAMLPLGLRSAPKIFTAVADALEWCVRHNHHIPFIDHYLDDFIVVGPPNSRACADALLALEECEHLGFPLAPEKKEGPASTITFLGILVDTTSGTLSLPQAKLVRLREEINHWLSRRTCRKRELESLVGTSQFAAKVIKPGRSFVRRLIDLLKTRRRPEHYIRLNNLVKSDLLWWKAFADHWNGVAFFPPEAGAELEFTSDASGSWGCGAWSDDNWWQFKWPASLQIGIAFKELFAVVLSTAVCWGPQWKGRRVRGYCDNQSVIDMLLSRTSKEQHIMHLLRCLFFIEAKYQFVITVEHIAGSDNSLADDLSRDRLSSFLQRTKARPLPMPIPPLLPELLLDTEAMWTSPAWMRPFTDIVTSA